MLAYLIHQIPGWRLLDVDGYQGLSLDAMGSSHRTHVSLPWSPSVEGESAGVEHTKQRRCVALA